MLGAFQALLFRGSTAKLIDGGVCSDQDQPGSMGSKTSCENREQERTQMHTGNQAHTTRHRIQSASESDDLQGLLDSPHEYSVELQEFRNSAGAGSYSYGGALEDIRAREFSRLTNHAYLDYAGAALYSEAQIQACADDLKAQLLCNPHSSSSSSPASEALAALRRDTLALLRADGRHYEVVITAGATAALRLVAEAFPWTPGANLSAVPADFVVLSYYKIFGHPTGLGALVVRREALALLGRGKSYWGGGTVEVAVADRPFQVSWVGYAEVGRLAAMHGLHLRTGCFCNPGACGHWLRLSAEDMIRHHSSGHVCWDDHDLAEPALVSAWPVGATGLLLDREWALVDDSGKVLTLKQCPRMALIRPEVCGDTVCTDLVDTCSAGEGGDERVRAWFARVLGAPCRIVQQRSGARKVDPRAGPTEWVVAHGVTSEAAVTAGAGGDEPLPPVPPP
eukprot:XP_001695655.1 predicted protein [Chlamydomonas reinhardtii]